MANNGFKPKRILIIPDTQVKPGINLDHLEWAGKYICEIRPDVIVHIGDHWDFESLSSYDKGKASAEGRRFIDDLEAGKEGMRRLLEPLRRLQSTQKRYRKAVYSPRMIFCKGNHEARADRFAENNPEFVGYVDSDVCDIEKFGWEVYGFLDLVEVDGICFSHYLANPFSSRPYGGTAINQLKTVGKSFVVGHTQKLDFAIRHTLDGKMQLGVIAGAFYQHDEAYKGPQGNFYWRGLIVLNDVKDGYGDIMPVSLNYLRRKYETN